MTIKITNAIICEERIFCIACFGWYSQVPPGQRWAFLWVKKVYILHPTQTPNADSKNINMRQRLHMIRLNIHRISRILTTIIITSAIIHPIAQANLFWGAPAYSGTWLCTAMRPSTILGANRGFTKRRIEKSRKNITTKTFNISKFPTRKAFMNVIIAPTKSIPAAARISRSLKTGIS